MAGPEQRLGWGGPISLDAEQADAARDFVANTHPRTGTAAYAQWVLLRSVLMPPPSECQENRAAIARAADWLLGLDVTPGVDEPDYGAFASVAEEILHEAVTAFESRPEGCEMEMTGDNDCFNCGRCNFSKTTDSMKA